ncbi:MAG: proline--tRNA ligase [Clostridia bacterium]|nr:proline--tRNA ligase [Clostridia bacterium]
MRMNNIFVPTLRSTPGEAEIASHKLLLRAGFIRRSSAGVYTYLPLAYRVLEKIKNIVRDEMNKAGGQEVMLPIIQPAELWMETGRWHVYGDEMFRLKDRHGRDFCLGPTHEEIITDLVRGEVNSYRQLPILLYQIQNKYRDERRPRFGLMRGREFIMKDLYSFDVNEEALDVSYQKMYQAYTNIFTRCGLNFRPVEADSGAIGGNVTHEFMVLAESGEATIVYCDECNYAANVEIAPCKPSIKAEIKEDLREKVKVHTPDVKTINEVAEFLEVKPEKCIKTLFYKADEELIVVLIRGDRTINEIKVQKVHPCYNLELASEEEIKNITGALPGSVGPIGLKNIKIYADLEIEHIINGVCGANEDDYHYINVNATDYQVEGYYDLRLIEMDDKCPKCNGQLQSARGIEVGQVFKLGTKYSESLKAKFLDVNGKEKPIHMGCYGIGVSRTLAAAVEQHNDENGIIWPKAIAPYLVTVIPVNNKDSQQMEYAEKIYTELQAKGIEVILDDRNERAGVKFKDADLIGFPIRITVGKKAIEEGIVEYKLRKESTVEEISMAEAIKKVVEFSQS